MPEAIAPPGRGTPWGEWLVVAACVGLAAAFVVAPGDSTPARTGDFMATERGADRDLEIGGQAHLVTDDDWTRMAANVSGVPEGDYRFVVYTRRCDDLVGGKPYALRGAEGVAETDVRAAFEDMVFAARDFDERIGRDARSIIIMTTDADPVAIACADLP